MQKLLAAVLCMREDAPIRVRSPVARAIGRAMTALPSSLAGTAASSAGLCWLAPVVKMAAVASGNWPLWPEPGPQGWTCFPRVATCSPGLKPKPVRAAREFAVATLERWGATRRTEDVATVVSELVTNALRHALPDSGATHPSRRVRLGLVEPGPCVLCAVADPSRTPPVPKDADVLAETGRGLLVVGAFADRWGYTPPSDMGKVVWAMFSTGRGRRHDQGPAGVPADRAAHPLASW
jgi:anti-sigma regulatory factor (Ser/Thr protein kinase)